MSAFPGKVPIPVDAVCAKEFSATAAPTLKTIEEVDARRPDPRHRAGLGRAGAEDRSSRRRARSSGTARSASSNSTRSPAARARSRKPSRRPVRFRSPVAATLSRQSTSSAWPIAFPTSRPRAARSSNFSKARRCRRSPSSSSEPPDGASLHEHSRRAHALISHPVRHRLCLRAVPRRVRQVRERQRQCARAQPDFGDGGREHHRRGNVAHDQRGFRGARKLHGCGLRQSGIQGDNRREPRKFRRQHLHAVERHGLYLHHDRGGRGVGRHPDRRPVRIAGEPGGVSRPQPGRGRWQHRCLSHGAGRGPRLLDAHRRCRRLRPRDRVHQHGGRAISSCG